MRRISSAQFSFCSEVSLPETNLTNPFIPFFCLFFGVSGFLLQIWQVQLRRRQRRTARRPLRVDSPRRGCGGGNTRVTGDGTNWRKGGTRCSIASFAGIDVQYSPFGASRKTSPSCFRFSIARHVQKEANQNAKPNP